MNGHMPPSTAGQMTQKPHEMASSRICLHDDPGWWLPDGDDRDGGAEDEPRPGFV